MQLHEQADKLEDLGVQVCAVTFESQSRVEEYRAEEQPPFPVLRDPGRDAYETFGLGRRPATTVWGPETLWYYGKRLLRGELPKRAEGSDQYQLGGDVILRRDRTGGWIFRSDNPANRPSIASILALLQRND